MHSFLSKLGFTAMITHFIAVVDMVIQNYVSNTASTVKQQQQDQTLVSTWEPPLLLTCKAGLFMLT
jgi:hypothetical protein